MFRKKPLTGVLVFLCTCFFGANLCAQTRADSTWPMFHHDMYHTGLSPLTGDMDTCFFLWSYTTDYDVASSPALGAIDSDGKLEVVVGGGDNQVYGLNGEDGSFLWSYITAGWVHSSPALGDIDSAGKLEVVVGSDDKVYALNGEGLGVEEKVTIIPEVFFISRCEPNPFTTSTTIYFPSTEHRAESIELKIYDVSGRLVKSVPLTTNHLSLGTDLNPGIYFLKSKGRYVGKVVKVR